VEIALDLDMVSAACPQCKILLVEGDSASFTDLGSSVNEAVTLGATEVSNSYGGTESSEGIATAADYSHPGVAIVASSGDNGYGIPSTPAVFSSVVSVGGTSLTKAANARGWSETAWQGAGSGCSAWIDKPAWQTDPNCPGRMVADVAADADPQTGPAIYVTDTPDLQGLPSGWSIVGGTGASSPYIAGVIALAGNPAKYSNASPFYTPAAKAGLNDVVTGNNITFMDCGGDYQCNAVTGYDGPTGWGTPNGTSAF
jgi:subtilase family serine protease